MMIFFIMRIFWVLLLFPFISFIPVYISCSRGGEEKKSEKKQEGVEENCQNCITVIISPLSSSDVFGVVPIAGISIHPYDITSVVVSIGGKTFEADISGRRWRLLWRTDNFKDGEYEITAKSFDAQGFSSEDRITVFLRNEFLKKGREILEMISKGDLSFLPNFSAFLSPQNGQEIGGIFPVIGITFHQNEITYVSLTLEKDDVQKTFPLTPTFVWFYMLNTGELEKGVWNFSVVAYDSEGGTSSASVTAFVSGKSQFDIANPVISIFPSFQTEITFLVEVPFPVTGTVFVVYPKDGMALSSSLCLVPEFCYIYGFYVADFTPSSAKLFVNGVETGRVEIYPSPSTYPNFGTFVGVDWWGGGSGIPAPATIYVSLSGEKIIMSNVVTINTLTYSGDIAPILNTKCTVCHSSGGPASFAPLTSYSEVVSGSSSNLLCIPKSYVSKGNRFSSLLYLKITTPPCGQKMPPSGSLTQDEINKIGQWIDIGAPP